MTLKFLTCEIEWMGEGWLGGRLMDQDHRNTILIQRGGVGRMDFFSPHSAPVRL